MQRLAMMKQKEEMGVALMSSLQSAMKGRLTIEQQKLAPLSAVEMKWERLVGRVIATIRQREAAAAAVEGGGKPGAAEKAAQDAATA